MPTLSAGDIAGYASRAGLSGESLTVAVAIALAESGGRTDAIGDRTLVNATWGPSVGLWQIRSLKNEYGTGGTRDYTRLTDPTFNARSMVRISNGGRNWRPWSVYTSGRYVAFLPRARAATRGGSGSGGGGGGGGTWEPQNGAQGFSGPIRIALAVAGGVLLLLAVLQFSGAAESLTAAASLAVTKGKGAIKAVKK